MNMVNLFWHAILFQIRSVIDIQKTLSSPTSHEIAFCLAFKHTSMIPHPTPTCAHHARTHMTHQTPTTVPDTMKATFEGHKILQLKQMDNKWSTNSQTYATNIYFLNGKFS